MPQPPARRRNPEVQSSAVVQAAGLFLWSYGRIWVYICLKPKMFDSAKIQISPEILSLIAEIDEFKGAWRALGTLAP
jgi:hypothetical protein